MRSHVVDTDWSDEEHIRLSLEIKASENTNRDVCSEMTILTVTYLSDYGLPVKIFLGLAGHDVRLTCC